MQLTSPRLAFLALIALLVTATSSVQAQTPTALQPLPGDTGSRASWINDWGEVAGTSIGSGGSTAVVWDEDGTPTPLPDLAGGFNTRIGEGNAINNKGEIAGTSFSGGISETRGVVWNRNGTILRVLQPIDLVGTSIVTWAVAINAHGWVAGVSSTDLSPTRVAWDQKGNPNILGGGGFCATPGGSFLEPTSINPRGQVSSACNGVFGVAAVWDRKGGGETLPPLPPLRGSRSYSINTKGEVAGESYPFLEPPEGVVTATVWDPKRNPRALPPLPGDVTARALGINNKSVVVGVSRGSDIGRAVMWDRDGNPTALPPLAVGASSTATGINRRGVIVGTSGDGSGNSFAVIWR